MATTTHIGRFLARGTFSDPEDGRTTSRLQMARRILEGQGITYDVPEHDLDCPRHPDNLAPVMFSYRDQVCCLSRCAHRTGGHWTPEWVTSGMLDHAAGLADQIHTARGRYNRTH